MKEVELAELRAMLQEISAATNKDHSATQAIMSIGTDRQPDWEQLSNTQELADVVLATRQALPEIKRDKITFEAPDWQKLEDIYYQRVIKPMFAD